MKNFISIWLCLFFTGCAALQPVVQNFNIISVEEERDIGQKMSEEIGKEMTLVQDSSPNKRVRSLGQKLVNVLPRKDFDYAFYVVRDNTPNAFTIPGGKIYVHTGLLEFVDGDAELAGVLGHEIGHAYERHPAKAISRAYGVEFLTGLLFGDPQGKFKTIALQLAKGGILTRYGREDERRADDIAYDLLKRAGLPTSGLLSFLRKLQSAERGGIVFPFLSTHPPTPERIARLETLEKSGRL